MDSPAAADFPPASYPIQIWLVDPHTDQIEHSVVAAGPGLLEIPAFHGRYLHAFVRYGDGARDVDPPGSSCTPPWDRPGP